MMCLRSHGRVAFLARRRFRTQTLQSSFREPDKEVVLNRVRKMSPKALLRGGRDL